MDEYVGMIRIFGGDWAPPGWLFCGGQLLPSSQYQKLYKVIGTMYGGNSTNFALPNLQCVLPVGGGMGPAPDTREMKIAEVFGAESHTLTLSELPTHNHSALVSNAAASQPGGSPDALMAAPGYMSKDPVAFNATAGYTNTAPNVTLHPGTLTNTGGGKEHENRQPFVAMNYIICVEGIFPPRPGEKND
ncbi:MAG: microcystin-dependent protein [Crocinitomicaceae bacterium]|jgi:microcystin-dependent protein|nr:microcystin-dependent protein [Crocinitomicaceae bacterium]